MSRVTSKLQVTIPKQVADQYGIKPGDDIEWAPDGESIRVIPTRVQVSAATVDERLALLMDRRTVSGGARGRPGARSTAGARSAPRRGARR